MKFNIPTQEAAPKMAPLQTVRSILYFTTQITFSVSQNQYYAKYETEPELAAKLELYQDKCADILATVFIDRKSTAEVILQPILDAMNNLINDVNKAFPSLEKRRSGDCLKEWLTNCWRNMDYCKKAQPLNRKQYLTVKASQGIAPIACRQAHGVVRNQDCSQIMFQIILKFS